MANLKFIVSNKRVNKEGKAMIFLRYLHACKATYISTKRKIDPAFWNSQNQKIKNGYSGFNAFNTYLEKFRQRIEDIIHEALSQEKEPSVEYVKEKFRQKQQTKINPVQYIDFLSFVKQYIDTASISKVKGTIMGYQKTLRLLKEFEKRYNERVTWDSIDLTFYDKFKQLLIVEKNYGNNSFGKNVAIIKTFLNDAVERGYPVNLAYKSKKFKVLTEPAENIYLNESEINRLKFLDLSNTPRLERARDLFIVGCYTGLRFSDFSQIQPENIKEDFIQIMTQKTRQVVRIPVHPYIEEIMKKYEGNSNQLPKSFCNQKLNELLKIIGKLAGLNEDIIITKTKGGKRVATTYKKYELLTTHCGRRSFATNLFKQGFPTISIMKITGHRTETSFMKYILVQQEETATMLKQHWDSYYSKPNTPSPILKIA